MTDDVTSHLDLDALADALADEGDADGAAHLASCASCTSRLAELAAAEAGVVAALRALPDPAVPEGLADRLDAALRAEPPLVAAASSVTVLRARPGRRRLLPAAAAAVLLVSAGSLGYALVSGVGDGDQAVTSDAGGAVTALPASSSGTDYADAAAVTGALPGVLTGSAVLSDSAAVGAEAAPEQAAGATGGAARSTSQVPAPAAAMVADPLARLRTPEGLEDCLSAVLPPEEPGLRPRAVDYALYQGQPALAVLLPDPDPGKVAVYVVGADCTAADARLLGFLRVDAP